MRTPSLFKREYSLAEVADYADKYSTVVGTAEAFSGLIAQINADDLNPDRGKLTEIEREVLEDRAENLARSLINVHLPTYETIPREVRDQIERKPSFNETRRRIESARHYLG